MAEPRLSQKVFDDLVTIFATRGSGCVKPFQDILFRDLNFMLQQILTDGNFFTTFETENGTLSSWEQVNQDISRLMGPFNFDIQFAKAILVVPSQFQSKIQSDYREVIGVEYQGCLDRILKFKKTRDIREERLNINRKLNGGIIINMSDKEVSPELVKEFENGKSFIRGIQNYRSERDIRKQRFLREEITGILNRMYFWGTRNMLNLCRNKPIKDELKLFHWETLEKDIVHNLANTFFSEDDVVFLKNIVTLLEGPAIELDLERYQKTFEIPEDQILVEADKGQGVVLLNKVDLIRMYERNNLKHDFIRTDLTEDDLVTDNLERRDHLASLIPKDVYKNLSNYLKRSLIQPTGMAPIFRPLVKVHKLDHPGYKDINIVSSRMVKSSSGAPFNCIAEVASTMTEPLINSLNEKIVEDHGWKPAMQDCIEVFNRLNQDDILHSPERLIGLEGDAVDMYLMMDHDIILKDIEEIMAYFEKDDEFVDFYTKALETLMKVNYWKQPGGIYTVGPRGANGFSIGCFLAANGSELIMVWREGKLLMVLKEKGLLEYVKLLSRYKDDFLLLLLWHPTKTIEIIKAVSQAFPSSLRFKFKISPVRVDFVDQSLYINQPNQNHVKLLRKAEASYDYPRKTTNTPDHSIYGTIHNCVRRSYERNTLDSDRKIDEDLYKMILKSRGFSKNDYSRIKRIVLDRKSKQISKKKWDSKGKIFSGMITFDKRSRCHTIISKCLAKCRIPSKYQPPLANPGPKIWQLYFKKRSFITSMDSFLEKEII